MKVGDLVEHKEIPSLGVGLVTKDLGVHCKVLWTNRELPSPTLEANSMLEVVNATR